ncbi:helix-turn-helix domain-containing protein [Bacteroides stercorirosoris]|uniref:Helix-turn-helix domain-containing protein n=1 Tax=Bacteroides stercorirosoris TaxID=871324 RepID=A0A1M6DNE8_9BACE|nr:AraC family transcriptional regulator [Bacteroides stercorirosoris]OKZ09304.1 MAG: hypothetical protein BHV75_12430 [Bacteroides oleiciplenus]SHI74659.1 Helix-turn-helix domain-containing protein [Bacteroides stercorirosoris]
METLFTKNTDKKLFERDIQDILPERIVYAKKDEANHASGRMKEIYENILYCIENKMIYLDSTINLSKFSLLLCTNTTYLSKVINMFFKCNLKTLLNKHRIEYAKELLKMEQCDLKTLPKRCGFASRSSFYAAFMKYEHIAPTDFRAHHMSIEIRKRIDMEIDNLLTI